MVEIVIPKEITLELAIGIIGIILSVGALVVHALKYLKNRPKIKLSFYKSNFESKDGKLTLDMILENTGNLPTTAKEVWVVFGGILKDCPSLMIRKTTTIVGILSSSTVEKFEGLDLPFKIEPNQSYTIQIVCNFHKETEIPKLKKGLEVIIKHTHGESRVKKIYGG